MRPIFSKLDGFPHVQRIDRDFYDIPGISGLNLDIKADTGKFVSTETQAFYEKFKQQKSK
jgi:hypothetical protein